LTKNKPVIALTSGEPADWSRALRPSLRGALAARIVAIGDRGLLRGCAHVEHVALQRPRVPGRLDPANSRYVLACSTARCALPGGQFDAMGPRRCTKVINDAASVHRHTEYLASVRRPRTS